MGTEETGKALPEILKMLSHISLGSLLGDITFSEYMTLKMVVSLGEPSGEETVHVSQIVEKSGLSMPAVSKMLRSLEYKGLLRRETDPANRRKTLVYLTDKGWAVKKRSDRVSHRFFDDVYERVGKGDIERFNLLAGKIVSAVAEELRLSQERK